MADPPQYDDNGTPGPSNNFVRALLTDTYQLTMTYAHWKIGKHQDDAVFELFFRKNPFEGQFTVFCGLDECLRHLSTFSFSNDDVAYLKSTPSLSHCEDGYFEYLASLNASHLTSVHAPLEGTLVFPREPLLILHGPLGLCQLLETTLLNLVNYPSLMATNASRMVLRAAPAPCIEFGLRRAQGPDGAMSASKYSYVGGFVATSNLQAGKTYGIPVAGTHAHAYVQAFAALDEVADLKLHNLKTGQEQVLLPHILKHRQEADAADGGLKTNDGELAAFCAYACAFPNSCLCLIDTYDTIASGLINFIAVAKALDDFGYTPKGIRLDSGDLSALSVKCKEAFDEVIRQEPERASAFGQLTIIASNDINEKTLVELIEAKHALTAYGIGTNLVTCQAQPALGCVYKLVEWKGKPRIKLSEDMPKMTLPGRKRVYRLYGIRDEGEKKKDPYVPLVDVITLESEEPPKVGKGVVCRHPFQTQHRLLVKPSKVECLYNLVFSNGSIQGSQPTISETRAFVQEQLHSFPESLTSYEQSKPHDIMVSVALYKDLHELWEREAPIEVRL